MIEPVELHYTLDVVRRSPFRRWRWELWHGATLLAAGWQLHPLQAQRTIRTHAVRCAHRINGLRVLRPDIDHPPETPWGNRPVTIDWGQVRIELRPLRERDASVSRVAAG